MPFEIFPTTAEHIIGATDSVLLQSRGCKKEFVADFLNLPIDAAENALKMAEQIGFIEFLPPPDEHYISKSYNSKYLVTSNEKQKATILKLMLENYEPFRLFTLRLNITGSADNSAEQIKTYYSLTSHRDIIKNTILNLGTYSQSIVSEGAGLYKVNHELNDDSFSKINEIVSSREQCTLEISKILGEETVLWANKEEVIEHLTTAYELLRNMKNDVRAPILYAANAYESFLSQIGSHTGVPLGTFHGINSKLDELSRRNILKTKHKFIGKYIGHIRNACDHGNDAEIGAAWDVSHETSRSYPFIVLTSIKNLYNAVIKNNYAV